MEQLIPRTLRRWENYQTNLAKSLVFAQFQNMTKGHISLRIRGDSTPYSFGYGNRVKAQVTIENERFFSRFWSNGELGFGESYVDGDWNSPDLAQVIRWFFLNVEQIEAFVRPSEAESPFMQFMLGMRYIQDVINYRARPLGTAEAFASHYDLEQPFFALMLDRHLNNSGAIFGKNETLEQAQLRKMKRLARELRIKPGSQVLELGCGFGGFAVYLAEHYDCHVTAVTLSEEQARSLGKTIKDRALGSRVTAKHADFRTVEGLFDRIISVELIDTLDDHQLVKFFRLCDTWLSPQGLMVHQLLLTPEAMTLGAQGTKSNEWNQKFISPGITTPCLSKVLTAMNTDSAFCIRNLKDIGLSYSKTLAAWTTNFETNRDAVKALGFDERFIRTWHYYLSYAEAAFNHGLLTAAQITMSRPTQRRSEEDSPSPG